MEYFFYSRNPIARRFAMLFGLVWGLVGSYSVSAQIIYTDIPDATPNATYPLDLNNDGTLDFLIQFDAIDKVMCKPQNNNAYGGYAQGILFLPWAMSASSPICDTLSSWLGANQMGTMASGTLAGNWIGATDKYLPLKVVIGNNSHYGWARFDVTPSSTSFTLKDYAFQNTPNTCILAGQTNVSVQETSLSPAITLVPNPIASSTVIRTSSNWNNAHLLVLNANGKVVKQINQISGTSFTFYRDQLSAGIYFFNGYTHT